MPKDDALLSILLSNSRYTYCVLLFETKKLVAALQVLESRPSYCSTDLQLSNALEYRKDLLLIYDENGRAGPDRHLLFC